MNTYVFQVPVLMVVVVVVVDGALNFLHFFLDHFVHTDKHREGQTDMYTDIQRIDYRM